MVFGFLKKLKGKKKEEAKEEKKEDKKKIGTCEVCKQPIFEGEKYKTITFGGQKMKIHVKCFRQLKKTAMQLVKGGMF